ncbi:MAG: tetratricopeptide repeat protein [Leptolyngbya sp. LCM1.Bin17]|nr:MAG: tetratricopeptide repeat protein [Leptolyngbya sp. LCM1.Bin17]
MAYNWPEYHPVAGYKQLMELGIWLAVVLGILGVGMGSMLWAYRRPLGNSVLFAMPVLDLSLPLSDQVRKAFQSGCDAFQQGRYGPAMEAFSRVVSLEPACAEAYHNSGLAYANLGNDGLAVAALVKASDLYNQQGTQAGLVLVKQQLEQLAARQRGQRQASTGQTGG